MGWRKIQVWQLLRRREQRHRGGALARRAAAAAAAWAADPTNAAAAGAFSEAQRELQGRLEDAAVRGATLAGVLWEDFGEQSTAWFHRLAEQRAAQCLVAELEVPGGEGAGPARVVSLADADGREAAAECIADFFDGDLPSGLFHPPDTHPVAQRDLLADIDRTLSPSESAAAEGALGAGGIGTDELLAALGRCAQGKAPGCDGLSFEFYRAFWGVLGGHLTAVFNEAFLQEGEARLPPSMLMGVVTLVYKGAKAGPRTRTASYRPITLLNCDYKILAQALTMRLAPPLRSVIDPTQTAFIPGRWIGDNVLMHLEEIDYLERTQHSGVIVFIDFEKAYDKISREWALDCLRVLGFGDVARRWVAMLLAGTRARVRVNGFHTRDFSVASGVAQGSPLSPILYVVAAQPLAARMRSLQRQGAVHGIRLPDGSLAPPTNQHADDTSLHLRGLGDVGEAWRLALLPFCAASGSRANASKTRVMLLGGAAAGHSDGFVEPVSGVLVVARTEPVRHLGIMLFFFADGLLHVVTGSAEA